MENNILKVRREVLLILNIERKTTERIQSRQEEGYKKWGRAEWKRDVQFVGF